MGGIRVEVRRIHTALCAAIGIVDVALWLSLPLLEALFEELKLRAIARRERTLQPFGTSRLGSGAATS